MPSVSQRIRILKYVSEQGVVSLGDVIAHLKDVNSPSSIRIALYKLGLGRLKYGHLRHGAWFIQDQTHLDELQAHFPDMPTIALNGICVPQIPHYLELNRIRDAFDNSSNFKVLDWLPEAYLRVKSVFEHEGFDPTNIPDAVFWRLKPDGTRQKYFLEFERTFKNQARYKDIFTNYASRKDTEKKNVIYICRDQKLKDKLLKAEEDLAAAGYLEAGKYFQFITLKGFYKAVNAGNQTNNKEKNNEKVKATH